MYGYYERYIELNNETVKLGLIDSIEEVMVLFNLIF